MKDGRSAPPPPPEFVRLELTTRAVNLFLGTTYTPNEIEELPELWIEKVLMLTHAQST